MRRRQAEGGTPVMRDQMIDTRKDFWQDHVPRRRRGDPRFLGGGIEERCTGQPYRFQ
jgi:hypothetical protein